MEHEAQACSKLGGHTIAKHVGRTEAQLQARDVGVKVGVGVARATGKASQLQKVRVVLVYKSYNGLPYYILTAFPVP